MYSVRMRAIVGSAGQVICGLWNPSTTLPITVVQAGTLQVAAPPATVQRQLVPTTAEGTGTTLVTPGIQHHHSRGVAPPSGVRFKHQYTALPTFSGLGMDCIGVSKQIASGGIFVLPSGIEVPPGTGLMLYHPPALSGDTDELFWVWFEGPLPQRRTFSPFVLTQ